MALSTRALLRCGSLGVPAFLVLFHADMLTRSGFDILVHGPSQLMTGDRGWLQIGNFVVTGLLLIAFAAGVRRTLPASRWAPGLIAAYGVAMICTGVFVTDPQKGYPPGTPQDALPDVTFPASWHEQLHTVSVFTLYLAATAACCVLARTFAQRPGGRPWALAMLGFAVAAPGVLVTGTLIMPHSSIDWVFSRLVIPLGWCWAWLAALYLLRQAARSAAPEPTPTR
ncbi:DUF998 domain-containing protein [Nonomuraea sp. NPDC059007]|uniref:DUF998 domain-containing protein n=1 Tax=Nonomuraea sp. NPDC059007 TaxID=3346692 RepID=UPI0036BD3200